MTPEETLALAGWLSGAGTYVGPAELAEKRDLTRVRSEDWPAAWTWGPPATTSGSILGPFASEAS